MMTLTRTGLGARHPRLSLLGVILSGSHHETRPPYNTRTWGIERKLRELHRYAALVLQKGRGWGSYRVMLQIAAV